MHASRYRAIGSHLLGIAALGVALLVVVGHGGNIAAPLDSIGHFRAHLTAAAAVLGLACVLLRRWVIATSTLGAAALGAVTALPFFIPQSAKILPVDSASYTLLQLNLRFDAAGESAAVLRTIAEARPDVITLQEVSSAWRPALRLIETAYPYQAFCDAYSVGGFAILSRRPFAPSADHDACRPEDGLIARQVDVGGRLLTVASLHLEWPWPHNHWQQIARLRPVLASWNTSVIVAGDFNAAPWSAAVRTLADAASSTVTRGVGPTWMRYSLDFLSARWFGLPIDNVLHSPEIEILSAERLAATTSDHLPVLVRFALPVPAGFEEPETATAGLAEPAT